MRTMLLIPLVTAALIVGARSARAEGASPSGSRSARGKTVSVAPGGRTAVGTVKGPMHARTTPEDREVETTGPRRMTASPPALNPRERFAADEIARENADQRRALMDPIVAIIRQGHRVMQDLPPLAAQADAVDHTREAAILYREALVRIDQAEKARPKDEQFLAGLRTLHDEALAGILQTHVAAGEVYASTGDYADAVRQAMELEALDPHSPAAHALRLRIQEAQEWPHEGIVPANRWLDLVPRRR